MKSLQAVYSGIPGMHLCVWRITIVAFLTVFYAAVVARVVTALSEMRLF